MTDLGAINREFSRPYLTVLKYFRYTGINLFDERNNVLFKCTYSHCIMFIFYVLTAVCHWSTIVIDVSSGTNLLRLAAELSFCYNSVEACCLQLYMSVRRRRIRDFIMLLGRQWSGGEQQQLEHVTQYRNTQAMLLDRYINIYCLLLFIFVNVYLATPLALVLVRKYILQEEVEYVTAFRFYSPIDYRHNLLLYITLYIIDYKIVITIAFLINGSLFLLTITINQLKVLFVELQEELNEMVRRRDDNIDVKIKRAIHKHLILTNLTKNLADSFGATFLIHLTFSSATICLYSMAAVVNGTLDDYKNLVASGLLSVNVYNCCKQGQLLTESAEGIAAAIYDSPWEDLDLKNKKTLALVVLRAQHACHVQSTPFTVISLYTFISIMKMSWSFFSLMTTLYR